MYETKILGAEGILAAADIIRNGGLVAFPTETVYGLGADAFNVDAVKKIFEVKGRPSDNPFILHVPSLADVEQVAFLTEDAKKIFTAFSPGPITVLLKKKPTVPSEVTANLDTVGVRIPSHKLALEFLRACKTPIAAPSANKSKRVSPTQAVHVYEDLNGLIPLILDGGACGVGIESTVLSLVYEPTVLRPGAVTIERLKEILPNVKSHSGKVESTPASPGMKYKHYSPTVPCAVFYDVSKAKEEYAKHANAVVFALDSGLTDFKGMNAVSLGANGEQAANRIFALFREYEKKADFILIEALEEKDVGAAVMNRLKKSADGRIIR